MATILKSDLVNNALQELGVQTANNPAEPEDVEACFVRLEQMMARYGTTGLAAIGYTLGSDISAESGLLQQYEMDVQYLLARRCAGYFGIALQDPLAADADESEETLRCATTVIPESARSELQPRGAGRSAGWWLMDKFYVNGETDGNET